MTIASAGDTLLLRGGRYDEGEVWLRPEYHHGGTPGQPITIRSAPGESASLGGERYMIVDLPYLRFEGLTFRMPWVISTFVGPDGWQIVGCTFEGPQPSYGAINFAGNYGLVEGNTIRYTSVGSAGTQDHGIYLHASQHVTVRNNTISGMSGYGIHMFDAVSSGGARAAGGYQDIVIEGNHISDSKYRSGIILASEGPLPIEKIVIRGNDIHNMAGSGVVVWMGDGIEMRDNAIDNIDTDGSSESGSAGFDIRAAAKRVTIAGTTFTKTTQRYAIEPGADVSVS